MKDRRVADFGWAGFAHEEEGGAQCAGATDLKDMPTPFRVRRRSLQGVFIGWSLGLDNTHFAHSVFTPPSPTARHQRLGGWNQRKKWLMVYIYAHSGLLCQRFILAG